MNTAQIMKQLTQIRKDKGWTQGKLAAESGTHQSGISAYEIGATRPDFETVIKLADALGYKIDVTLTQK